MTAESGPRSVHQAGLRSILPSFFRSSGQRFAAISAAGALLLTGYAPAMATAQTSDAQLVDPIVQEINVSGTHVDAAAQNRNGLTFKGFGILTGNSTSSLLMDYKAQQPKKYWELVETLFGGDHPIMNTIKIEMGNDRNTSTGPNAGTMRTRDEYPNIQREPGFQLAADAQLVAYGDIHLSILRWNRPAWVTNDESQYLWFKNTVLAAYREYGIMVDSINPDANETHAPNAELYKSFSGWVSGDTAGYEGATAEDPNNGFISDTEKAHYQAIQTIAGDTVGTPPTSFGDLLTSSIDPSLRDAVDILGFHYASADDANGNLKKFAETYDKEVWNSEGQATFSNSADRPNNTNDTGQGSTGTGMGGLGGPLEMSNWITTGFAQSRRTQTIFQPAIGSFYDGFQYSSKELVSARDPWSGWLYYDAGLAALEHYTQFAAVGWENEDNTAGIWRAIPQASGSGLGGGNPPSGAQTGAVSYTTLAAPDKSAFSTVIVNDSAFTKTYKITADGLNLGSAPSMELWETRATDAGGAYDANYVKPIDEIATDDGGSYTVTVKPWSTLTATTLDHALKNGDGALAARDGYGSVLPTTPEYTNPDGGRDVLDTDPSGSVNGRTDDEYLYADDFDYTEQTVIQTYDPTTGALVPSAETYLDSRGGKDKATDTPQVEPEDNGVTPRYTNDTNGAFESVATSDPAHGRVLRQQIGPGMAGGAWNGGDPKTTIGDFRWANYKVSVDALFDSPSSSYATVGAREQGGTSNGQNVSAAELRVDPAGSWTFMRYGSAIASGQASDKTETNFQSGANVWNNIAVQVAGDSYTAYINGAEVASYVDTDPQATGRIQLGSAFTFTQFDNLKIETIPGYTPYYTDVIDGMHQTSWNDSSVPVLQFNDKWSHANGQGMYEWQRSASNSTGKDATMSYTFTGTGVDVLGNNPGTAKFNVTVDGVRIAAAAQTWAAGSERTTFKLRGLENGQHTVVLETATEDAVNIDAVGVIKANADSGAVDLALLEAGLADARELQEEDWNPAAWATFTSILQSAAKAVADPSGFGLDSEGAIALSDRVTAARDQLVPKDISEDVRDLGVLAVAKGAALPETVTLDGVQVAAVWDAGAAQAVAGANHLASVSVTGRTAQKVPVDDVYQRFNAVILVAPDELEYFIDSGSASSGQESAHSAIKLAQPNLLNETGDQLWNGTDERTAWGYSTTSTGSTVTGSAAQWDSSFLSADFNKPILYHLSLPAGTYNITAVQASRPGYTTNIYSTVTAGSHTNKVTATSTGAATPVSQSLTLTEPTVVGVEFGTNGTSGYNGRLALVYVQAIDRDLNFQGTLTLDSALPETVTIEGNIVDVTWDEGAAEQKRSNYESVMVRGTVATGKATQGVTALYEVVPEHLMYYIDAGTSDVDSPQYSAVRESVPTLANDKVDQVSSSADQWGYVADGMKLKTGTSLGDKYSTGMYQDTTQLIYRLPLEAGSYTLTAGFSEWWGMPRTLNHTVSGAGVELAKGNIPLSGSNNRVAGDLTFTLTQPETIEYLVTNEGAGGEKPVISWLAVAVNSDTTTLRAAINAAILLDQANYTPASWAPFSDALEAARAVLTDPVADQNAVDAASQKLAAAQSALITANPVKLSVQHRCLAGKATLAVTAVNESQQPVSISLTTPFGTKLFTGVAAGKSAFHAFTTRAASTPADTVEAVVTSTVDGSTITSKQSLQYPAHTC